MGVGRPRDGSARGNRFPMRDNGISSKSAFGSALPKDGLDDLTNLLIVKLLMKKIVNLTCLVISLLSQILISAEVSIDDEIPVLETKSGRRYEQVKVRAILPDGLKIMHSSGTATLSASELPQYEQLFSRLKADLPDQATTAEPTPPPTPTPLWMPATKSDVADCSLFIKVTKGYLTDGSISSWNGTGFLCNLGSQTYIYSNAHNFDGAIDFTIEDQHGNKYSDFDSIESASNGHALWKEARKGGDVVRIRLINFREKALTLDSEPITKNKHLNKKIIVTGNTGGKGKITQLEGIITDISDNYIIKHNAATEGGNSGSPIVDLENFKVLGILTWGGRLPEPLQAIWIKKPAEVREGLKSGAGLATVRFSQTSFEHLQRQRLVMNRLKQNIRLLGLLDTLVPTKQGLFVNRGTIVMGDYTVDDLLQESSDHPVVTELVKLDRVLSSRAESNIGMNNQDMLKLYVATHSRCLGYIASLRKSLENSQNMTFYMRCIFDQSRMLEVAKAYENLSARSLQWYSRQQGTGGQALPLEKRFRLPQMRSGLEGLGIKED